MKQTRKIQTLLLCVFFAAFAVLGSAATFYIANAASPADASQNASYYGDKLTDPVSKIFYNALENMNFTSGNSVAVNDQAVLDEAAKYSVGDPSLLAKFGAAVDSFRYDHSELFYVDFDLLSVNVKRKSNYFSVEIGAGRSDTYFVDGFNKDNIGAEISWYNDALNTFVNGIGVQDSDSVSQKAEKVATAVCNKVTYDFCVDENGNDMNEARFIRTAYGALKYGKAVCEGYSRIFKAALDKLGVKNVLVCGTLLDDNGAAQAHMWNAVFDGENWLACDPTLTDSGNDGLIMANAEKLYKDHFEDPQVSTSGYKMPYPEIKGEKLSTDFAAPETDWVVDYDKNGLKIESVVLEGAKKFAVTYNGMDRIAAENAGFIILNRIGSTAGGGDEEFGPWLSAEQTEIHYGTVTKNGKTYFLRDLDIAKKTIQFAVIPNTVQPDTTGLIPSYSDDLVVDKAIVAPVSLLNPLHDPDYVADIYARDISPRNVSLDTTEDTKFNAHITYSKVLTFTDGSNAPKLSFKARYFDATSYIEDIYEWARIENVRLDIDAENDTTTIYFDFYPSTSYTHNEVIYEFTLSNMKGVYQKADAEKYPPVASMLFQRVSIACPKVFGGGKLYISGYGTPTLVDNSDLSMKGWTYKDENGKEKKVSESQRSQLALVVKTPKASDKAGLENAVDKAVGADNVMSTATYELNINLCKNIPAIPNGSFLKLSFGFPAGITAESEGVEFEVYHFKRNAQGEIDYSIEPEVLNCVVTKYGLTVTVHDFSPFVIVARKSTEADKAKKGIVTALNGMGGSVSASTGMPVNFLESAEDFVEYTITPDAGNAVEYVLLNGKALTVSENKVKVNYADLEEKNNILSVGFVSSTVLEKEQNEGVTNVTAEFASKTYNKEYEPAPEALSLSTYPDAPIDAPEAPEKNHTWIIILVCVLAVVLVAGVAVFVAVFNKKRHAAANASASENANANVKVADSEAANPDKKRKNNKK